MPKMSNETYDLLKYLALVAIPAFGTLVFTVMSIFGLPYGEEILGTITAIDAFMGAILQISNTQYKEAQK